MEWKTVTAEQFCTRVTDGTHDSPKRQEVGRYLITSKHLSGSDIDFSSAYKISEEDYQKIIVRSNVEQYDILFSMIGTIGNTYRVTEEAVDYAVKNMAIFKFGGNKGDSSWFYYWLKSPQAQAYISQMQAGSTQGYLTLATLRSFPVAVPDHATQDKIAAILSSLDDKIENNNRINRNLEEQAQALFKSWFIDFEPFGGSVPNDWKEGTLEEICTQLKEKVGNRDNVKVLSPVTTGKLMLSEEYFSKQVFSQSIAKYIVVPPTAFAYNPARVNIGSLGMNEFDFDGCVSPVYVVFECRDGYEYFFDLFRRTNQFKEEVKSRAIGGVRQTLGYDDFKRIQTVIPPKEIVDEFNKIYVAMLDVSDANKRENQRLATLRDTLLPKLMKGEIEL